MHRPFVIAASHSVSDARLADMHPSIWREPHTKQRMRYLYIASVIWVTVIDTLVLILLIRVAFLVQLQVQLTAMLG